MYKYTHTCRVMRTPTRTLTHKDELALKRVILCASAPTPTHMPVHASTRPHTRQQSKKYAGLLIIMIVRIMASEINVKVCFLKLNCGKRNEDPLLNKFPLRHEL